jgi:hypothetical protein
MTSTVRPTSTVSGLTVNDTPCAAAAGAATSCPVRIAKQPRVMTHGVARPDRLDGPVAGDVRSVVAIAPSPSWCFPGVRTPGAINDCLCENGLEIVTALAVPP